jgi:hypothetical protein
LEKEEEEEEATNRYTTQSTSVVVHVAVHKGSQKNACNKT